MSDGINGIEEILDRIAQLDDDLIYEISAAIEELMVRRRAAFYEAQHRINVRFSEQCRRGEQLSTGAGLPLVARMRRWWRRYDVEVERVPRRGTRMRIIDWRAGEWREIMIPTQSIKRVVRFLTEARQGSVRIAATNGIAEDVLDVPAACRRMFITAIAMSQAEQ